MESKKMSEAKSSLAELREQVQRKKDQKAAGVFSDPDISMRTSEECVEGEDMPSPEYNSISLNRRLKLHHLAADYARQIRYDSGVSADESELFMVMLMNLITGS